jgi:hypothetical protein
MPLVAGQPEGRPASPYLRPGSVPDLSGWDLGESPIGPGAARHIRRLATIRGTLEPPGVPWLCRLPSL